MTRTAHVPPAAAAYLADLRGELGDLEASEREELLEDVVASLVDATDAGEQTPVARLGTPAQFAAELRAAAGLRPREAAAAPGGGSWARLRSRGRALLDGPQVRSGLRVARELAPLWWLARAYVLLMVAARMLEQDFSVRYPFLPLLPDATGTAFWAAVVVAASLAAGVWTRLRPARGRVATAVVLANLALLAAAVPVAEHDIRADAPALGTVRVLQAPPAGVTRSATSGGRNAGLTFRGKDLRNVFAYDRTGRLVPDVRLYDAFGHPLDIPAGGSRRRLLRGADGRELGNTYPIRLAAPGTGRTLPAGRGALGTRISPIPRGAALVAPVRSGFERFCSDNPGACPARP
ncbi:hypothetical protein DSM112329_04981 [Paraconexibacter sp. AEG42_29]|uniref:Uncharacterized protein n=1 Tax=Paraconexibacter sp. AEG42_29 TaxID=2997339 RepID=A0AAU7B2I3_9ACTN